ncbi:carcinoembryonic antigen-related cell adhesion molecule 3-like, partial [Sigmodon hispidus]
VKQERIWPGSSGLEDKFEVFYCRQLPPSVKLTIKSIPPITVEGGSVLLAVYNLPKNLQAIFWYKGITVFRNSEVARHIITTNSSILGPAHSGRETMYSDGSLLLHNVTWKDTGFYTLRTLTTDLKFKVAHVQLLVERSFSTYRNPFMSAHFIIEPKPWNAATGDNVLLLVHNLPKYLRIFTWFKSTYRTQSFKIAEFSRTTNSISQGPAHSRTILYTNGSLLLQNVTEEDAGFYTLQTLNSDLKTEKAYVQLHINPCRYPPATDEIIIESVPPIVVEGKNALLLVHNIPENLRSFGWYKGAYMANNQEIAQIILTTNESMLGAAHSGRETVYPNGSFLLYNAMQKDTGFYTLRTLNKHFETQETHVYLQIY